MAAAYRSRMMATLTENEFDVIVIGSGMGGMMTFFEGTQALEEAYGNR